MDYSWAPWFHPNAFITAVDEANVDLGGYLPGATHINWCSYHEWGHCFIIVTNGPVPSYFPTFRDIHNYPRFRTALGAQTWLFCYKMLSLSVCFTRPCPLSFDVLIFWTSAEVLVGDHARRLASRAGAWHRVADAHQEIFIWDEPQLPANYRQWKNFDTLFWFDAVRLECRICLRLGGFAHDMNRRWTSSMRMHFCVSSSPFSYCGNNK